MQAVKVSSGRDDDKRIVSVQFDVPNDYDAAVERWNEGPVFGCFVARLLVKVQDTIRNSVLKADDYNPETAQAKAQAVADEFLLDAPRRASAIKVETIDQLTARLQAKSDAGEISRVEAKLLKVLVEG